jgi:hypothetical protein
MAGGEMVVYYDNETFILAKHVTFTRPFLNQTFEQNYLNSKFRNWNSRNYASSVIKYTKII